ncbi:MAG: methylated-DNA--[protein]-cysteine S-methyltransferase [Clostridia bacterium]|nr:methylated-DNA--[protein]-cysteine S-methyltransferase [Clostridia bacterium]
MNGTVEWNPLRIGDAARLSVSGVIGFNEKDVRSRIREWVRPASSPVRAFAGFRTGDGEPRCVGIVTIADPESGRGILHVPAVPQMDLEELTEFLCTLIDIAFFRLGLHRLELAAGTGDDSMADAARASGMKEEGILRDVIYRGGLHRDGRSFVLLRPESTSMAYGFVPFEKGLVTVLGSTDGIRRIGFIRFGEMPDDGFLRESAAYRGYLDSAGTVAHGLSTPADVYPPLPAEVDKACRQIGEYLAHRRSVFDINVDWTGHDSGFQRRVWRILAGIGYGRVWTYEDVAAELVGTRAEARRMTRAVGAACAANPVPILVPCHRVIGKDGKLTGFSGGVDIKEFLLAHEWIAPPAADPGENA